jgi:coenzyme F420-0:L-glutamate ligase/coenzyme F420-1:gamma-L-glutamate ligase
MPEVRPGDDLAGLLLAAVARAGLELVDGDVLAVTSKVVAKAEGRLVPLPGDPAGRERVHRETVAAETARVVARRGRLVIAETRHGLVGANALVDASNAGGDRLVLLPADPDASAARLRAALRALDGHDVSVVVTDTLGRPWRLGQTDVAVGLAGMGALDDWRGRADGDGRPLEVTEVAVADEVAAAADLVKGKASRVPAALLRGVPRPEGDGSARDLVRPAADDLFRTAGTAEDLLAFLEGPPPATGFRPDPVDPAILERAVAAARAVPLPGGRRFTTVPVPAATRAACLAACSPAPPAPAAAPTEVSPAEVEAGAPPHDRSLPLSAPVLLACCLVPPATGGDRPAAAELAAGGAVRTLLLGLHALGLAAVFQPAGPPARPGLAATLGLEPGWQPLGLIATGRPAPALRR